MQLARLARPLVLLAATTLSAPAALRAQAPATPAFDAVAEARKVVADLAAGRFAEVEARYSAEMLQALPAGRLALAWAQVSEAAGEFKEAGEPQVQQQGPAVVVTFPATYERARLNLIVAFDGARKLAGLLAQPAP